MKPTTLALAMTVLLPFNILAQQNDATEPDPGIRTLLGGDRPMHSGGWGALTAVHTRIMDQDALLTGIRGGWIIDHHFTLGLAGYGLVTDVHNQAYDTYLAGSGLRAAGDSRFELGYGGLLLEPVVAPSSPIHLSFPIIVGAGGCTYGYHGRSTLSSADGDHDRWNDHADAQAFFVVEPGAELESTS